MRLLIILAAVVVLFALVGWLTFSNDADRTSINIETDKIRQDTGEIMHQGSELLREAEEEVTREGEEPPPEAHTTPSQ